MRSEGCGVVIFLLKCVGLWIYDIYAIEKLCLSLSLVNVQYFYLKNW